MDPIPRASQLLSQSVSEPFSTSELAPALIALHEVVGAVARQTDPRMTLGVVAEKARLLTQAASAAVSLLNSSRTLLDFAAVAGTDAAEIVGQTVRAEDALAGRTALTGEVFLTHHPEAAAEQTNSADPSVAVGVGVRSAIVVPIYLDGTPSGAVTVLNRTNGEAFTGADLLCLQTLAGLAAQALQTDGLKRLAAEKQRERDILFRAAQTTSSSLNVQDVLGSILLSVVGSMEMSAGAVFLLNDERTRLYIGAERGLADDDQDRQIEPYGQPRINRGIDAGVATGQHADHTADDHCQRERGHRARQCNGDVEGQFAIAQHAQEHLKHAFWRWQKLRRSGEAGDDPPERDQREQ